MLESPQSEKIQDNHCAHDLNNLAAGESRYREDGNRQAKLKSAIKGSAKGNVARK